jgi:hypothetical protein
MATTTTSPLAGELAEQPAVGPVAGRVHSSAFGGQAAGLEVAQCPAGLALVVGCAGLEGDEVERRLEIVDGSVAQQLDP